jgi:hypothetical protein
MAVTETIIHCQVDREPNGFCESDAKGDTFSFAVNLSIDCRASGPIDNMPNDEEVARKRIVRFLEAAQDLSIAVYRYRGKGEELARYPSFDEVRETDHIGQPAELIRWLDEQKLAVMPDQQRFWAPEDDTATSREVTTAAAGAGDRLRAIQSWNAPIGHGLGLTRIIRINSSLFSDNGFVALPFDRSVSPPAYLPPLLESGNAGDEDWYGEIYYDPYGGTSPLKIRTTPVKRAAERLELDKFAAASLTAEGYLKINPDAAAVHRITRWFEERAASMMAPAAALGPRDATADELQRIENLCAFVEELGPDGKTAYRWDKAIWYGASRLVAALDNLVVSIVQPPEGVREGDVLAPYVSLALEWLADVDPRLTDKQLLPEKIAGAMRSVFKENSALANKSKTDAELGGAIRHVHGIPKTSDAIVEDSDLVAELVEHFTKVGTGKPVGERLKQYAGSVPRLRLKVGEVLTRAVAEYEQRLNEESGAEAAILRLLETVDLSSGGSPNPYARFAERYISDVSIEEAAKPGVRLAFERAWIEYRGLLEGPFNGAEAVRRASGNCFTRALLVPFAKMGEMTAVGIAEQISQSDYFARRFLGSADASDRCFDPISTELIKVGSGWHAGADETVLRAHLVRSFADAVDSVQALTRPQRFVPDRFPRPLPVQIGSSIDGSKIDEFAKALNGMAVAIRRHDDDASRFAHAHLADLFWAWPSIADPDPDPKVRAALDPMLPGVSDGRAPMFIEYEGYPFADGMPIGGIVGNGDGDVDRTRAYYGVGPHTPHPGTGDFASLPMLAYGRTFQTFAFVTSNAGTLPIDLQRDKAKAPWMPLALGASAPSGAPVVDVDYQRTTAISEMAITEPDDGPALFGKSIDKVMPLAHDYPRAVIFATKGNSAHCDLFRSKGGFGEIPIPANPGRPSSQDVTLSDIRWAGQPKSIRLQVMDRLSEQPHVLDRLSEAEKERDGLDADRITPSFDIPADGRSTLTVTFRTVVPPEGAGVERFLVIDGEAHALPSWLGDTCWLRLVVEAPAGADACVSFAEVEGSSVAGGPLLLLRPKSSKSQWNNGLKSERRVTVSTPRVVYHDFDRWYANPDRRAALPERLRRALMLAYALRDLREELAPLIDRLPDPAVQAVRIDFAMIDTLAADLPAHSVPLDLSGWLANVAGWIFEQIEKPLLKAAGMKETDPTPWTVDALVAMLTALDRKFRFDVDFNAGEGLTLVGPSAGSVVTATAPEGSVTLLCLNSYVSIDCFTRNAHPSMFDARLLQYASVIEGGAIAAFPGPSLRMEVMAGMMHEVTGEVAIALAERMIATEPVERLRRYDLVTLGAMPAASPDLKRQHWRLLSEVDVTTQRWRPSGRPIYSYIKPKDHVDESWDKLHGARPFSRQLAANDDAVARFEHEAFFDRPHLDAHTLTQRLKPLPSRTTLQQVSWEAPSATYFRHRFTLRSRYAGALVRQEDRECPAWPTNDTHDTSQPPSSAWARPWTRRVVMLADASRTVITRPQLRALIPLTTAPDADGRQQPTPPVAAILQEPPFAHGGLADRIAAEVRTGFGYGFERKQPGGGEDMEIPPVEILDSRKEAGPAPYLSYRPLDVDNALGMTLIAEGPMGLTFDAVNAPAPAFPNCMFTLRPTTWCGSEPPLEELMMGVSMRRYIDPAWTTTEAMLPRRGSALSLDPERSWLIGAEPQDWPEGRPGTMPGLFIETSERRLPLLALTVEGGHVMARTSKLLIDGEDTTGVPVLIARFAKDRAEDRLLLLSQPVSAGRYCTALLATPTAAGIAEGASNLPVVIASFEWSLPKDLGGKKEDGTNDVTLVVSRPLRPSASETIASAQTFIRWTRTGRDFDFVHVAAQGSDGWTRRTEPVSGLAASITGDKLSIGRGQPGNGLWSCSSTFTSEYPLHVHRHLAVITSHLLTELGRPVERHARSAASGLRQPTLVLPKGGEASLEDACRVIEYETPAAILCDWARNSVPEIYKTAYFDLLATGFRPGNNLASLRLFVRFVAPFVHRNSLTTLKLRLGTNSEELQEFTLAVPAAPAGIVGLQVTITTSSAVPSFAFLSGAGDRLPATATGGGAVPLANATTERPGLYLRILGNSAFELWTDVSLLHSIGDMTGEPFDFDWLFSRTDDATPVESVNPGGLNIMVEAQARIVSVSPPIPIVRH